MVCLFGIFLWVVRLPMCDQELRGVSAPWALPSRVPLRRVWVFLFSNRGLGERLVGPFVRLGSVVIFFFAFCSHFSPTGKFSAFPSGWHSLPSYLLQKQLFFFSHKHFKRQYNINEKIKTIYNPTTLAQIKEKFPYVCTYFYMLAISGPTISILLPFLCLYMYLYTYNMCNK